MMGWLNIRKADEEAVIHRFGFRFYARIVVVNNDLRHFEIEVQPCN